MTMRKENISEQKHWVHSQDTCAWIVLNGTNINCDMRLCNSLIKIVLSIEWV